MLWSLLFITLIGRSTQQDPGCSPGWETIKLDDKVAFQSSVYTENGVRYGADRVLDGNYLTDSDTLYETITWWTVDLLGLYEISCISIYNQVKYNIDLRGARILIGNSSERNAADTTECATINTTTNGENKTFNCENGTKWGRYVTVYKDRYGPLTLCEVTMKGRNKEPFKLIKENKTWADALYHCREEHMDLVSILDEETQGRVGLEAQKADTPFVWLGLQYTCGFGFWIWVNDQCVFFDQWAPDETRTADCGMSAAMNTSGNHLWYKKSVYDKYNFICAV
ncbi:fucolectin-5-like [Pelmatolapia mariae]|uniref:fucolectin-5-like n=1 Tax=Pelmatolapia mariae TaxID=158779 RepID=UPI002FE58F79